ncbi:MAG TPA: PilZ domain-containing protein [Gemmataceae bacterium]|jgi:c-di-GMP-binding flagellar brake protein YcgR|nr:PilZ domain-containing protein [Gemmataceae bacterium]
MSTTTAPAPVAAPVSHERRSAPRHSLIQRCFAKPASSAEAEGWRCIVYNISAAGVGITLPLPLKNGAVIYIEPWNLPGAKPVHARIVRSSPLEYVWLCGCEFLSRLTDDELRAWLPPTPATE